MGHDTDLSQSSTQRKLVAIIFADIQGYTALMQKDEARASNLLKRFQSGLLQEVKAYNGSVVQFYGDGALCTFSNPLEAVRCAITFQSYFRKEPMVPVRAGIHMGTVVIEEGMAYGDSINLTSRIESLGVPGSILLSKRVRDEVKNHPEFQLRPIGSFDFKNVSESMRVYALEHPNLVVPNKKQMKGKLKALPARPGIKWPTLLIAGIFLVAITVLGLVYFGSGSSKVTAHSGNTLQKLAVLPFINIRQDPDTDYLGLALAEEIIGDLNYVKEVLVKPSSAVRKYAQSPVDAPTAGNELNVDYILAGNYIKEGNVIRIDLELVGVGDNELVWRQEFKTEYKNTFELQDIVSEKVLQGLKVQFSEKEDQRTKADISKDPLAYEYYLRALALPTTVQDDRLAVDLLQKSILLDSLFAPSWSELGWRQKLLAAFTLGEGHQINQAEQKLEKALELNPDLLSALNTLVAIYVETGRTDKAVETARHALEINPNNAENHFFLGYVYRYSGFLVEAEQEEKIALKLDPDNMKFKGMGITQIYLGKYEEALELFRRNNSPFNLAWQGQIHLRLGNNERALNLFSQAIAMDKEGTGNWAGAMKSHLEGKPEEGLKKLVEMEENLVDAEQFYNLANLYGLLGYKEECIRTLRKTVSRGFFCYPVLLNDRFLDSVRTEPGFQEVLEEAKIKHEAFGRRYFSD